MQLILPWGQCWAPLFFLWKWKGRLLWRADFHHQVPVSKIKKFCFRPKTRYLSGIRGCQLEDTGTQPFPKFVKKCQHLEIINMGLIFHISTIWHYKFAKLKRELLYWHPLIYNRLVGCKVQRGFYFCCPYTLIYKK